MHNTESRSNINCFFPPIVENFVWKSAGLGSLCTAACLRAPRVLGVRAAGLQGLGTAAGRGEERRYDLLLCFFPLLFFSSPFRDWTLNLVLISVLM